MGFIAKLTSDMCQDLPFGKNRNYLVSKNEIPTSPAAATSGVAASSARNGNESGSSVMYQNFVKAYLLPESLSGITSSSSSSSSAGAPLTKKEEQTLYFLRRYLPASNSTSTGAGSKSKSKVEPSDVHTKDIDMELLHDSLATHLTSYMFWLYGCVPPAAVPHSPTNTKTLSKNSTPSTRLSTSDRNVIKYAHLPAFRAPLILTRNSNVKAGTNAFEERQEYEKLVNEVSRSMHLHMCPVWCMV